MISNFKDRLFEDESWYIRGFVADLNDFLLLVEPMYQSLDLSQALWNVMSLGEFFNSTSQSLF